jgi:hypothetical protein
MEPLFLGGMIKMETQNTFGLAETPTITFANVASMEIALNQQ